MNFMISKSSHIRFLIVARLDLTPVGTGNAFPGAMYQFKSTICSASPSLTLVVSLAIYSSDEYLKLTYTLLI